MESFLSKASIWADDLWLKHEGLFTDRVMTEVAWAEHRKPSVRHKIQPSKFLKVTLGYFWLLLYVVVITALVGVYDTILVERHGWPMLSAQASQAFLSSITFALTLLMVFKTNSSYARWWEARKAVGQLVSLAHNLARMAVAYFPPEQHHLTQAACRWASTIMWVVKAMVNPSSNLLREELEGMLWNQELEWLLAQPHKPLAVGQALSSIIAAAAVDPMTRERLDSMLTLYTFQFGACGRIYNTAIPACYTRHTSRFLLCYIFMGLPLLLWPVAEWASPLLAAIVSFLLLGVENIGAQLEEPFHVIAFEPFCAAVQRDVANILKMHPGGSTIGSTCSTSGSSCCTVPLGGPAVRGLAQSPAPHST